MRNIPQSQIDEHSTKYFTGDLQKYEGPEKGERETVTNQRTLRRDVD